jgi:glucose-6-phosphate 1-dehydrogenase
LAYKKIFPSLQAMVKRGTLNVPVIGVAKADWNLDLKSNHFRFRISPEISAAFGMNVMAPNTESEAESVELVFNRHLGEKDMDAYERVLTDAMAGDATLFARQDYVEEARRVVDDALKASTPVFAYEPQTWGPKEVERLTPPGGWQNPVVSG